MRNQIRSGLIKTIDSKLVDELLDAYQETKLNFQLGGYRLSNVEGGRFCEAAFRILEQITTSTFTPLGKQLDTEKLIKHLANLPNNSFSDSVRLYIPRALRVVYDIRNNRDAAHLADGIDPNIQDSTLVVSVLDWVLAEYVRLYHNVAVDIAQSMINDLVERVIPIIQDFDGFLKVLKPNLKASEYCLVLLYQCGQKGASIEDLKKWVKPKMRGNLERTLNNLDENKAFIHISNNICKITIPGQREVERKKLIESAN